MRDSIVFYRSFWDAIKNLPETDQIACVRAILEYGLNENEPEETGVAKAIFMMAKPQIDANNKRYQNGTKGGRPTTNQKPNDNQNKTTPKPNVNENVNVNENDKRKNIFVPPTVEDVKEYCDTKGHKNVSPEQFVDFYESKGWMIGKNKMKDWKSAVRNWDRNQRQGQTTKATANRFNNFQQRNYDYDLIEAKLLEGRGNELQI